MWRNEQLRGRHNSLCVENGLPVQYVASYEFRRVDGQPVPARMDQGRNKAEDVKWFATCDYDESLDSVPR